MEMVDCKLVLNVNFQLLSLTKRNLPDLIDFYVSATRTRNLIVCEVYLFVSDPLITLNKNNWSPFAHSLNLSNSCIQFTPWRL